MLFIPVIDITPGIYMLLKCREVAFAGRCPDVTRWRGRFGVRFLCRDGCGAEQTNYYCFR